MEVIELLISNIRVKLAEVNMKHQTMAEYLEVSKHTFSYWVNGKTFPPLDKLYKMARKLNCKVDELYTYIEEEN